MQWESSNNSNKDKLAHDVALTSLLKRSRTYTATAIGILVCLKHARHVHECPRSNGPEDQEGDCSMNRPYRGYSSVPLPHTFMHAIMNKGDGETVTEISPYKGFNAKDDM